MIKINSLENKRNNKNSKEIDEAVKYIKGYIALRTLSINADVRYNSRGSHSNITLYVKYQSYPTITFIITNISTAYKRAVFIIDSLNKKATQGTFLDYIDKVLDEQKNNDK